MWQQRAVQSCMTPNLLHFAHIKSKQADKQVLIWPFSQVRMHSAIFLYFQEQMFCLLSLTLNYCFFFLKTYVFYSNYQTIPALPEQIGAERSLIIWITVVMLFHTLK